MNILKGGSSTIFKIVMAQITTQLVPELVSNMYVCLELYYKHGEWESHVISSDEAMRTYCIDQLEGYGDQDPDTDDYEELHRCYTELPLDDLIRLTIEKGRNQIEHQWGWGLQSVVKCKNAVEYTV